MSSGRRVHERYALELEVTVIHRPARPLEAGQEHVVTKGVTQNVSLGGALLTISAPDDAAAPPAPIPFGAEVKLRLLLAPLKEHAEIGGTVRWIKDGAVGIQFGILRAKEVWALNQMFRDAPTVA
ncbi:MAG: PilZ domain-containing protein [Myxococcota bacterium]|nr:PilZ domain-containing protein [Myxococcota bacterium]